MEYIENLDWTGYTIRVVSDAYLDEPEETFVYVHTEVPVQMEDSGAIYNQCEECQNEFIGDVETQAPHEQFMRYWFSQEVSQNHDWPHQDFVYCGRHMLAMANQTTDEKLGMRYHHYNTPVGLVR